MQFCTIFTTFEKTP